MITSTQATLLLLLVFLAECALRSSSGSLEPLCEGCLPEPLETEYFGGSPGKEPPRLRFPVTLEEFDQLARSGKVLILENASSGTAMEGWSCERLSEEFPEARMRREYDWVKNPQDRNIQNMGNAQWTSQVEKGEDAADRLRQDQEAPPYAPFYWGVREHRQGDIGSKKVVKRIQQLIADSVPSFMDRANADSLFDNAEFWLGAKGTGARAHMDSHCISTLSVVLHGERRWRIGPVPRMPKGGGRSADDEVVFDDGIAYKLGWKPMFEFTLKEGEALLFPPGWIHETLNTAEGCTVALTTQFDHPTPVRYYRSYYNRLRRVGDLAPCWGRMMSWAGGKPPKKADAADAKAVFEQRSSSGFRQAELDFYDVDEDGNVSQEEFVTTFVQWAATERAVKKEKRKQMPLCDMDWMPPKESQEL